MCKHMRPIFSIALLFCLLLPFSLPVYADETEQPEAELTTTLHVGSAEELLELGERCRLDSYSRGLTVVLDADIDLSGTPFAGIPIFAGTFDGNGHSITGLSITGDGSVQGLFRYLQPSAVVRSLHVEGIVAPSGSRNTVGGIAGSNAGLIEGCSFTGTVTGADHVGGMVGTNQLTGIIDDCTTDDAIAGNHFVGGIAGENLGVIRNCANAAQVNTTATQNDVDFSDITLETLTGSESVNTVTDVGGIAGESLGVIRNSVNDGNVGYPHMGYNIGGIAGTQSGYIAGCTNRGQICGRKEAGGIVGQMEPVVGIQYTADTLQLLRSQLDTLESLTDRASANAQAGVSGISDQLPALQNQVSMAGDAVNILLPSLYNQQLPDADTILAAQNGLSGSLGAMPGTLNDIASSAQNTADAFSRDMQAISNQINAISNTIEGASEHVGGSITDVSDLDTAEDLTGKVEGCSNHGAILADLNAGGIAGAIAFENDLDPDDDVAISGDISLNFSGEIRAVILRCENTGAVTVGKQRGGGIVGRQLLGLIRDCTNTGGIDGEEADYVGGIAGMSDGYIRSSNARCALSGDAYVGGIAGMGSTVTDCRSMVLLSGRERLGSVLGFAEDTEDVLGNYYLNTGADIGAVDGISYAGVAESLAQSDFLSLEDLPKSFQSVTVRFLFDDETIKTVTLAPNGELRDTDIPPLPEREGYVAVWGGLEETDRGAIPFDMSFEAVYAPLRTVISCSDVNENGLSILLAQGVFSEDAEIILTELSRTAPTLEGYAFLEGREFEIAGGGAVTLRYLSTEECDVEALAVMLANADGQWHRSDVTADGSYLVFDIREDDVAFCLLKRPVSDALIWGIAGGAGIAVILGGAVMWRRRRSRS